MLNAGLRLEAFDNKNSDGDSYIKIDDMVAPRFGFSWDMKRRRPHQGVRQRRPLLPAGRQRHQHQAGRRLPRRAHVLRVQRLRERSTYNGATYQLPILGAQIGAVDNSQGDGTVGDLRGEVDADMDPVYQDELILGFQAMIDDKWSWGVRGIYRKLEQRHRRHGHHVQRRHLRRRAGRAGFVMANPGDPLTIFTDTNCDGDNDGFVTIDTSRRGWAHVGQQRRRNYRRRRAASRNPSARTRRSSSCSTARGTTSGR